jgi:2,3-bisphosphoglycerate-independent phosphoglycerate mutase
MIVIDGMSDRILMDYGKTPLEMANIPNLDRMTKEGLCGQLDVLGVGRRAGSDTAHLAILGYDPHKVYTGRGPLEVAGTGIKLKPGDVSLRCNYATVDENFNLISRTAGQISESEGTKEFEKILNEIKLPVEYEFRNSLSYRCGLHLRGAGLSGDVCDAEPKREGAALNKIKPTKEGREAEKTSEILNKFIEESNRVLKNHPINLKRIKEGKFPANVIISRGAGRTPELENFYDKWKMKGAVVAGIGLIKGLGYMTGMDVINVPTATGYIDSDFMAKGRAAIKALKDHDFVLLHVEGTDEPSHDRDVKGKITALERVDEMIGYVMDNVSDTLIVVLADHTTSTDLGDHTADPTPLVLRGGNSVPDEVSKLTEKEMYKGGLHRINGRDLMPLILDQTNRAKKFGA